MHGDAADFCSRDLAFPGVKARPHLEADLGDRVADRAGATDRSRRAIEGGEEAIARHVADVSSSKGALRARWRAERAR